MFHTFFYEPIYNLIAFVITHVPLHDIGATIVIVTLVVKAILTPLNLSALKTQYIMKKLEKEFSKIKELQKTNPQQAGQEMIALYKREKINPFSSIFVMIIQIPIFFALYFVFSKGLHSDPKSLYSFVTFPEKLHTLAFGIFDVTQRNVVMAIIAGMSSYVLARRQTEVMVTPKESKQEGSFQEHFMQSMRIQMLYVLPVIIAVSATALPSALALYWTISNITSYGLDVYMKHTLRHYRHH